MKYPPKCDARSSYDQIADLYDDDMGRNMLFDDVRYYVERALERPDRVLELGSGTGRITLPLLRAGLTVTGVDISFGMLSVLRRKLERETTSSERGRAQLLQMDIQNWGIQGSFTTILCPHSLFTYIVELASRQAFLCRVREQLRKDGQFILDAFIPNSALQYGVPIWDYKRALASGRFLERSRIIEATGRPQVNLLRRTYNILEPSGRQIRTFTTTEEIHYFYPDQLRAIVEESGFRVTHMDLDYGAATAELPARFVTLRCSPP